MNESCKVKNCQNDATEFRGICDYHLEEYRQLVSDGNATWEGLENKGLVGPVRTLVDGVWTKIDPETTKPKRPCLVPGCESNHKARGLCSNCYQTAWNMIRGGNTTWEILVKAGLARESQGVGRFIGKASEIFLDVTIAAGGNPELPKTYIPKEDREKNHPEKSEEPSVSEDNLSLTHAADELGDPWCGS